MKTIQSIKTFLVPIPGSALRDVLRDAIGVAKIAGCGGTVVKLGNHYIPVYPNDKVDELELLWEVAEQREKERAKCH